MTTLIRLQVAQLLLTGLALYLIFSGDNYLVLAVVFVAELFLWSAVRSIDRERVSG